MAGKLPFPVVNMILAILENFNIFKQEIEFILKLEILFFIELYSFASPACV